MSQPDLIHHIFTRTSNNGERSTCMDRKISPGEALKYFHHAELAFGSSVASVTPTEIVTKSSVMGVVDDMTFTGSEAAMKNLVQMATFYKDIIAWSKPAVKTTIQFADDQQFNKDANDFMVALAQSGSVYTVTMWKMLEMFGAIPTPVVKPKTLVVALDLIFEDLGDPKEVLELCGIATKQ